MKKLKRLTGIITLGIMTAAVSAWGATTLPVTATFDAALSDGWSSENADVSYPTDDPLVGAGNLSMINDGGTATLTLDVSGDPKNVWWRGFAKVTLNDGPSASDVATAVAAFYVNIDNEIVMWNTNEWVTSSTALGSPDIEWIGYAVHLDYNAKQWDLYVDTTGNPDEEFTKVNDDPLGFNDEVIGPTSFSQFIVKGETQLDEVNLFAGDVAVSVDSLDSVVFGARTGLTDQWYVSHVPDVTPDYSGADIFLDGKLGRDLASGMAENDLIQFYINGWNQYMLVGGAWVLQGTAQDPSTFAPAEGTVFWIKYATPTHEFTVFDPAWLPATLEAEDILADNDSIALASIGDGGWTAVRWTADTTRSITAINLPTDGIGGDQHRLLPGTEVFVVPSGATTFMRATWDGTAFIPKPASASMPQVSKNAVIWIKRTVGDAVATWTVQVN